MARRLLSFSSVYAISLNIMQITNRKVDRLIECICLSLV
jgi:hypothetical protein